MTSFVEKSRKAREQRMNKQVIDYNAWLDDFMTTRAWSYFKAEFDLDVVNRKNEQLERKYLDKLFKRMLKCVFFANGSDYKHTERYKNAQLDKENKENAAEMLQAISTIQKIRNRAGFKSCGIEQFARQKLFLWLNGIDELTHDLADDIESNPEKFVASNKLNVLDKTFEFYQTELNAYLANNTEFHFDTFHCITFSEPIPQSSLKNILNVNTALTIYFHDLLSRTISFENGDGYPQGSDFCTIKNVGWTVPAKLALAAMDGRRVIKERFIDDTIYQENLRVVKQLKDSARKFVKNNKFTINAWTLNHDHA